MRWRGSCTCHTMNLGLKGLKLKGEPTDEQDELLNLGTGERKGWRDGAVEGRDRLWCSLAQRWCARTRRRGDGAGGAGRGGRPPEKLKGGKPRWQRSSPGKDGERVASQWRLGPWNVKVPFPK